MKLRLLFLITVLISSALSDQPFGLREHYYGNSKIGELILNDIDGSDPPINKIMQYKNFFDDMMKHDGMYSIAGTILGYQVNRLRIAYDENKDLQFIAENLLTEIKQIPWNMTVTLYNLGFEKYLCSSDDQNESEPTYYKVYTLRNLDDNCYWSFNVEANGRFFTIQNKANHRYLFAAANQFDLDHERRRIYTIADRSSIPYTSDKWQLEPVRNTRSTKVLQYRIKNFFWDEYIYNFDDNSLDREVLAWKPLGCDGEACHWKIARGPNELPIERQNFLSQFYNRYHGNNHIADMILEQTINSSTQITEYRNLYDLMNRHDGLYSVAAMSLDYNVQTLLEAKPYDPDLVYIEESFRKQWKKFPWNNRILIKNEQYKRFLCPTGEVFKNTSYLIGYTLRDSTSCLWKIEADQNGQWFRIKSASNDGYLFAAPNEYNFDPARRRVFITNNTEEIVLDTEKWQFEHARRTEHLVRIKNMFWDEYLYNFNDGKLDRDLLTWRPFGCDGDACLWRIIDADATYRDNLALKRFGNS